MRWSCLLLLCCLTVPICAQPTSVLLLPPPLPPASAEAQDAFVTALAVVGQKVLDRWAFVSFHRESPSFQRAKREGKLPPEALTKPYEFAERLCAVEGAKVALWVRVTRAEGKTPQAIEARALVPVDARFETNVTETPVTEEERRNLRPLGTRMVTAEQVLALRLGRWLQTLLAPPPEATPSQPEPSPLAEQKVDWQAVDSLVKEKKWDEAVLLLSRLIAETPTEPQLYLRLGQIYEEQQRWEEALLEYRRAVQLQPELWVAWKGLARAAQQRNRWSLVLEACRQLLKAPEKDPTFLLMGARAAWTLAEEAQRRGRDKEAKALRDEAAKFDAALVPLVEEPQILLEAAERFWSQKQTEPALTALTKAVPQLPDEVEMGERALQLAGSLKRFDLAYQVLTRLTANRRSLSFSQTAFRVAVAAMDQEAVRLFERVRNDLSAFDALKLSREDLLVRLQQTNDAAEQLVRIAHALQPLAMFARSYERRLLGYELFLQATTLLLQWAEQPDDLTRRRAVALYEFARTELEQAWRSEPLPRR